MNYYKHHIGDFDRATRHLTRIERSVYRDLLDVYYDTEQPLTLDLPALCRKIIARSNEEATAVEQTLNEFFTKTPTGWYHERCEEELDLYRDTTSQKSIAGKASAAKRAEKKQQALNGKPTPVEIPLNESATAIQQDDNGIPTNHKPLTINQVIPHTPQAGQDKVKSAIAFKTYVERCKAEGLKPIPEDDAVFSYVNEVGIPHDFLRLQWCEFRDRYSEPGSKRYKDWRAVFRKSVRGNWFRLWYCNESGYALTTQGQQAKRKHLEAT